MQLPIGHTFTDSLAGLTSDEKDGLIGQHQPTPGSAGDEDGCVRMSRKNIKTADVQRAQKADKIDSMAVKVFRVP